MRSMFRTIKNGGYATVLVSQLRKIVTGSKENKAIDCSEQDIIITQAHNCVLTNNIQQVYQLKRISNK